MTVFVCVDDELGMTFFGKRQSRDSVVIKDMIKTARVARGVLVALPFSEKLLSGEDGVRIDADAIKNGADFLFIENEALSPFLDKIDKLIVYRWNRLYPSDKKLDTPPEKNGFHLLLRSEFKGSSHDVITKEVFVK